MTSPLLFVLALLAASSHAAELPRANAPCAQAAEPTRWTAVGTPDVGATPALISNHRGANLLAPENTLWAFRHAFAYESDFIEVDVRESADGVFYCLHDEDFARTTGTAGQLAVMTSLQIDQLNAANFEPWIGSEYDPSPVPRLEDILEIAKAAGKGIEFDIKFVKNYPLLFQMAADAGVQTKSFYNMSGDAVTLAQTLFPDVRVIFNIAGDETPQALYDETMRSTVYGSRRDKFTPERIAAIHDGCSVVLPHSYDAGPENEAAEFLLMRAAGADGAQVNQPDVIRAALMAPVDTALAPSAASEVGANAVCLTNPRNGFGLPYKTLTVTTHSGMAVVGGVTNRFGCIKLPGAPADYVVSFARDASAQAAQFNTLLNTAPPAAANPTTALDGNGRFGGAPGLPLLAGLAALALLRRRFARVFTLSLALSLAACGDSTVTAPALAPAPPAAPSPPSPAANPDKSLARAHAHNDYQHTRPLLDALDQGFTSVEADVYVAPLPAGTPGALAGATGLYVAHDPQDIRPENTLAALYLEPLKARIAENGGCVQKDCAPFHILIDAKTEAETTYAAIEAELAKYDALFTKYENGGLRPGAVTATLSGNRPLATMQAAMSRYTFYDGRFSDLDSAEPVTLMPLISDSWTTHFGWDGNGPMPADQKAKLIDAITKSHARGRRVRLYNVPDAAGPARENIWQQLLAADQDQINTDDLAGLRAFLLANDPQQR
ncbi:MAG: glycerophosphodiester phosphodiesterase family protein [Pseudomonadota bacterium]